MTNRENLPIKTESTMPLEYLEELASDQRRSIHNSVQRLRSTAESSIKDRLDVKKNLRQHFWPAAGVAAVAGLVLGYGLTGVVTGR
jgi:ElaB/YqjD/DUF883 family membrane-anchored ribosome-binding protein